MTHLLDKRSVRVALWLSVFVTAFNVMTFVTLLPTVVRDLETTVGTGQTSLVLLALVSAIASSAAEYLSEVYGRRRVFRSGLVLFAAGLLITIAGATSLALLVGLSVFSGLGAAVLVTTPFVSTASEGRLPEPTRRNRTGYLMLALTAGTLAGPVSGGLIATAVGWRWAFVPQLLIVAFVAWLVSPLPSETRQSESIDWTGTVVVLISLACIAVGIGLAGEYGWWRPKEPFIVLGATFPPFDLSIAPLLLVIGLLAGTAAFTWALRKSRTGGDASAWRLRPLLDGQMILFALAVLLLAALDTGISFALYTYLPVAADLTTIETVIVLLPKTGVTLLVSIFLVYRSMSRPPEWRIVAGFAAMAVATVGMAVVADQPPRLLLLGGALALAGAGVGLASGGLFAIAETSTTGRRPTGSLFVSGTDLGAALGVAVFGAILISVATLNVVSAAAGVDLLETSDAKLERVAEQLADDLLHLSEPDAIELAEAIDADESVEQALRSSVADAMRVAFLAMTAVSVAAVASSFALWRRRDQASGLSAAG